MQMIEPTIRQVALLESDWRFHLGDVPVVIPNKHLSAYMANKAGWAGGAFRGEFDDSDWRTLNLPHDWSIEGKFDQSNHVDAGFLPRGIGWYRRHFRLEEADRGKYLALQFDGVATHCVVAINGHILHRNFCGYTSFTVDFSDVANFGDDLNVVSVRVDATPIEGWWYEGAGIYRDVTLIKAAAFHIRTDGVFVRPRKGSGDEWLTEIETELVNDSFVEQTCSLQWTIEDDAGQVVAWQNVTATIPAREALLVDGSIKILNPKLWSLENPQLYCLKSVVSIHGVGIDDAVTQFGYRTIQFDPDKGFLLNDQPTKLKGTCNHQDHAGVGVAVPASIEKFRIRRLLEMGTNAYRSAHNPPSSSLLDACDRLGMLVMDENRNFGSSPEHLAQLQSMVRRDRNHPCIVLWSICNEEAIQGTAAGGHIARAMQQVVQRLDNSRPVTAAVSGGILNENGIGGVVEVMGINYQLAYHDQYHAKYPQIPLLAAETHCVLSTRGTYETRGDEYFFASSDSDVAPWGASARQTWAHVSARPFVAGLFAWTGFDYRGEPTPHAWPCVNTHYGMMDMCGFAKDAFYLNKAFMATESFVHLSPHWNWAGREGELIRVTVSTNCAEVELFVNEHSFDRRSAGQERMVTWDVPYEPGQVKAIGFATGGTQQVAVESVETSGAAVGLGLEIHPALDASSIPADGRFAIPVTVYAVDAEGNRVPTADHFVTFAVKGQATILGVGNGNPICHEPDKATSRSLFHGLAQVILQTTNVAGEIELTATADGLSLTTLQIQSTAAEAQSVVAPAVRRYFVSDWRMSPITTSSPDLDRPVAEDDVNSWDRIDPAAGPQQVWNRTSGYAVYRATCKPAKFLRATGGRVVFNEIIGEADVYIDGIAVGQKTSAAASEFAVLFPANVERFTLSVVIHAEDTTAGISRRVELLPK